MTNTDHTSASTADDSRTTRLSSSAVEDRIIVMARCPEAGKAKTRLIPSLGPDGAAKLHYCLVQRTLKTVRNYAARHSCDIDVQFTGGAPGEMQQLFGDDLKFTQQQGKSLGDRIHFAVHTAFSEGCRRVIVIGTDCPQIEAEHIAEAFSSLQHHDVVIGPALDGGYYLIGLREHDRRLFENINWGSSTVLRETLQAVQRVNKSTHLLLELSDIDNPEDLVFCRLFSEEFSAVLPKTEAGLLSIVIPTLNEATNLPRLLQHLAIQPRIEVIVADGGSTDPTCRIAEQAGVKIVRCERGRGRQMNAGASLATGEIIAFLHADTQLPNDFADTIRDSIATGHSGGAFQLQIDDPSWRYRIVELGANLRSRLLRLPYGDQAVFVRSEAFFGLNGFRNWPLMEDYDFVQRLRRVGSIAIVRSPITVSARRWKRLGVLKATLLNQIIIAGYQLGVSPEKLAGLYKR